MIDGYKKLQNKLEQLFNDPYEHRVQTYFDWISWLESKIEGKLFAEIVREKAQKAERGL